MRKQLCVATAFVILFVVASPLAAANQFYVGIKGGIMKPDAGGYDDAVNGAVLLGFEFLDLDVGSIAIEGEYTETISEGDATFRGIRGEWDIETYAIYGVFRTRGTLFFKGKIGYLHEDVSSTVLVRRCFEYCGWFWCHGVGLRPFPGNRWWFEDRALWKY